MRALAHFPAANLTLHHRHHVLSFYTPRPAPLVVALCSHVLPGAEFCTEFCRRGVDRCTGVSVRDTREYSGTTSLQLASNAHAPHRKSCKHHYILQCCETWRAGRAWPLPLSERAIDQAMSTLGSHVQHNLLSHSWHMCSFVQPCDRAW